MHKTFFLLPILLLAACATGPDNNRQTVDFRHFVRDFFQSPDFQLSRIRFPLEVISYQYENGDGDPALVIDHISEDEWTFLPGPDFYQCDSDCYDIVIYDNFAKQHTDSGERVLSFEGVNNGINSSLYFTLQDGGWQLVRHEQFDN